MPKRCRPGRARGPRPASARCAARSDRAARRPRCGERSAAGTAAAREALERTALALDLTTGLRTQSLVHGTPAGGILQAVAGGGFDWVVLVAHPRSFLGELFHRSVTAHVLLHSSIPVLVLPAA
ncbi:MAG: universal stress protein [Hymenobacter sp.]